MTKVGITYDTKDVQMYLKHLQTLSYKDMNNGVVSLVRQTANDIKRIYQPLTPMRTSGGKTGKYGVMPGNLRKSLRIYKKRQIDPFVVQFSVGFNASTGDRIRGGIADGYYSFFLNRGVAGRQKKKPVKVDKNTQFVQRARDVANRQIEQSLSERGKQFIQKKLKKMIERNG